MIQDLKNNWVDSEDYHRHIHETFCANVYADEILAPHRKYIRETAYGFGEDSFWWLWKLILNELPSHPALLEIGVYRSATLSVWKLLRPDAIVFGITPLDTTGGLPEDDYAEKIRALHEKFNLPQPNLLIGSSHEPEIVKKAGSLLYDCVYVDGDHSFGGALQDLTDYSAMVKKGGYFVIDDCNTEMSMIFGYFQGIPEVYEAKKAWLDTNPPFEFVCSVVHISVFRRV